MSPSIQWPAGSIGPLSLDDIINNPNIGSPSASPPSSPPSSPPPSSSPAGNPLPPGQWTCWYPDEIAAEGLVLPKPWGIPYSGSGGVTYYAYQIGTNQSVDNYLAIQNYVPGAIATYPTAQGCLGASSPPPPQPPQPPPCPPGTEGVWPNCQTTTSPPPPPPPLCPPPPGCVHVCIDNWPTQSPTTVDVNFPSPPITPPSPPVPTEPITTGYQIPAVIASCMPNSTVIQAIAGKTFPGLLQELGILDDNYLFPYFQNVISTYQDDKSVFGRTITAVASVVNSALNGLIDAIDNTGQIAGEISGCGTTDVISATLGSSILGLFQKWIAELPAPITAPWVYYSAWACPVQIPSHEWANEAYARTFISENDWKCLVRANGQQESWQAIDVKMRAHQPSELDLLLLWRKGLIASQQEFYDAMGVIGWTTTDSIDIWVASQQWVPSPTDAIEWMIKDVSDQQIQAAFGLEAEFTLKYQGATKDALDYNGISESDALNLWRAHWRNMAPTTLYELHKRLRPGWIDLWSDAEVTHFVAAICPAKRAGLTQEYLASRPVIKGFPVPTYCDELPNIVIQRAWLNSLITDGFDVSEALGQADYPAIWRARLLALSYKVMTRVDVRRAYEVGALTPEQAVGKFQDQGYSPPDAITLLSFYRKAAIQLHSRRPICNQWVKTGYDINLLKQSLISQGMREDMAKEVSDILVIRRKISIQQECMEGIHKRFIKGMIDETGAKNELLNIQFPIDQVADVVNEWTCIKASKPKTETVAEICNEFRAGILTGKEAQKLIQAQGYSPFAARRILSLCYLQTPPKTRRHRPIPGSPLDQQMQAALDS